MLTKVLITVKAYPAISTKYGETVCTAGITEEGQWIRIYPIPFRKLDYKKQFKKYDWIEIDLVKNEKDFRPESYRPRTWDTITTIGRIPPDGEAWSERRKYVLKKVCTNLEELIAEAKNKELCTSLATFKPTKIIDFFYESVPGEWSNKQLQQLKSMEAQGSIFETKDINNIENFEAVNKLPYKFSFKFEDDAGKKSTMMIEDWETGMLYWNSLRLHEGDEQKACEAVKNKYWDDFAKTKDYHFFLGTTHKFHNVGHNPFVIIGDFRPKHIIQQELF